MGRSNPLRKAFDLLASVKLAVPLLVLIAASSIAGGFIPQGRNVKLAAEVPAWVRSLNSYLQLNDIFHSWWYISLLGLLALSLLAITLKRFPAVYKQQGRGAGTGILLAHLGILIILGGLMYGGVSGFRYYTRVVEGDVTVIPRLPFVIKLDRYDFEYYDEETFRHLGPNVRFAKKQESSITLFRHGSPFLRATAAPGRPVQARGITLLPSEKDIGWAFDLVIRAPNGKEKVVPISPWAPPLVALGFGNRTRVVAHRLTYDESRPQGADGRRHPTVAEVVQLRPDGTKASLGFAKEGVPLKFYEWSFSIGRIRPYTGLRVYRRPEKPFLLTGLITLLVGLAWFFLRPGRLGGLGRREGSRQQAAGLEASEDKRPLPEGSRGGIKVDVARHPRD